MDIRPINYFPSFIVSQKNPNVYGDKQEDYIQRSHQIIEETANKIILCRASGGDLKALFFEIITYLSEKRSEIAFDHQSEDAEAFGKRRDHYYPGRISQIFLDGAYKGCNSQILKKFSNYLKEMDSENVGKFKNKHVIKETHLGRKVELSIEVFNSQGLKDKDYIRLPKDYLPANISHDLIASTKDEAWTLENIKDYRQRFKEYKVASPEIYQNRRFNQIFSQMQMKYPSPANLGVSPDYVLKNYPKNKADHVIGNMKSLFVHVVLRTNVNQKMFRMTDYLTWMYETGDWLMSKDPNHYPVKRMQERSICGILHQDEYLIEDTLHEVATLFENVLKWDQQTQTIQDLKDAMKPYCFVNVHNTRDVRGLSAENEWLEQGIFRALNVNLKRSPEHLIDLIAYANPLYSDFCKEYDAVTQLTLN